MSNELKLRVRRTLTAEFKREAVELIRKQGLSVAEAARRLDVHRSVGLFAARRWVRSSGSSTMISPPTHLSKMI